jgi:uncharacterized protein YjbJ (UPF0337 family)
LQAIDGKKTLAMRLSVRYQTENGCVLPYSVVMREADVSLISRFVMVTIPFLMQPLMKGIQMNWDQIEGNWKQFKGNVKQQWGKLTDNELDVIAGRRDKLAGRIQEMYGITQEEADKELTDWQKSQEDKTSFH